MSEKLSNLSGFKYSDVATEFGEGYSELERKSGKASMLTL